ncbi:MAG TPA: hypothetical protein VGD40_02460 [Chryseosolibacter sp.]
MRLLVLVFLLCAAIQSLGQDGSPGDDARSVDSIITAVYDVISGEKDQPQDWARFKNLFTADARLIPTFTNKEGKVVSRTLTVDDYQASFTKMISQHGFYEKQIASVQEEFGNIVHVFSTYETRHEKNGPVKSRGINSIQLLKGNDRYYVMTIAWSQEDARTPIPSRYLPQ